MTPEQLEGFRAGLGIREGREWEPFEAMSLPQKDIEAFLRKVPFNAEGRRRFEAPRVDVPTALPVPSGDVMSTQEGFGKILNELARDKSPLAERIAHHPTAGTASPNLRPRGNTPGI